MKYNLVGQDGNAYFLMGYTFKAMRECGFSKETIAAVEKNAKSKDYNHLLCVLDEQIQRCNEIAGGNDTEEDYCPECGNPYEECDCD